MADSVPPRLEPVRVAFLRDPKAPPPDELALDRAGIEVVDLALPSGDEQVIVFMIQALAAGCQAVVLDLDSGQEELAGRLQVEADVPVVYASHAALIVNLGRTLASLEALEKPLEETTLAVGGTSAFVVGRVLQSTTGLDAESVHVLESHSDSLPPGVDLVLLPDIDLANRPPREGAPTKPVEGQEGEEQTPEAVFEVGLLQHDRQIVLPGLIRAAADLGRTLPLNATVEVGRALAALADAGQLPDGEDPRLLPTIGAAVAEHGDLRPGKEEEEEPLEPALYGDALEALRSPLRAALRGAVARAAQQPRRLIFTDGEDPGVLSAARSLADDERAIPILLGDLFRLEARARDRGLSLKGIRVINPKRDKWRAPYAEALHRALGRDLSLDRAAAERVVEDPLVFGALTVVQGEADALVVLGDRGSGMEPLELALQLLPRRADARTLTGAHVVATPDKTLIVADTTVHADPTSEDLSEAVLEAANACRGLLDEEPRVALLAHTAFATPRGDLRLERITRARELAALRDPDLRVDGPITPEAALDAERQSETYAFCALDGPANALVLPNRDAARTVVGILAELADAEVLGPFLWGLRHPLAILPRDSDVELVILLSLLVAAQAIDAEEAEASPSLLAAILRETVEAATRTPTGIPRPSEPLRLGAPPERKAKAPAKGAKPSRDAKPAKDHAKPDPKPDKGSTAKPGEPKPVLAGAASEPARTKTSPGSGSHKKPALSFGPKREGGSGPHKRSSGSGSIISFGKKAKDPDESGS